MALTDVKLRTLKHSGAKRNDKHTDGRGLYLAVTPSGGKLWRFDYRFAGKRKTLALGAYPDVSLAQARAALTDARALLAAGTDPSAAKQAEKAARLDAALYRHIAHQGPLLHIAE